MPNKFDQRKLLDRLNMDIDAELMSLDLNEMLEQELSKPAEEVDVQLVDELLNLLDADEPTEADQEACWQEIQRKMRKSKRRSWTLVLKRAAAVIAIVAVLFVVSFESARAFRWNFLLKLLAPVAETFGLYSVSTFDSEQSVQDDAALQNEDTEYEQVNYASLDEMPAQLDGYRAVPAWTPERFAFLQGSVYEDPDMASVSSLWKDGEDTLILNAWIFQEEDAVFNYEFERTLLEPITADVDGVTVTYYHNLDDEVLSASWIEDRAHYHIFGNISSDELDCFIRSMLE